MEMYLGGNWVNKSEKIPVHNPYDQSVVDYVPKGSRDDMLEAISLAEKGYKINHKLSVYERSNILSHVAKLILERQDELARIIAQEGSKTLKEAHKEVGRAANTIQLSAEEAKRLSGETLPFNSCSGSENRTGYYFREPVGIIGAITPYNDPLNLVCHKVGPAIAGGNAVIVKPATVTPLSALYLAKLFDEAGLPKGILSVITGPASEVGTTLVEDERIRMISFTGGVETGEKIIKQAGLKKVSMELGSNSPVIVTENADLDKAAESIASGAFYAVGQNCIGVQRIYVQASIYEEFKSKLLEHSKHVKAGSQFDDNASIGPMITEHDAIRVVEMIDDAKRNGASVLIGGHRKGTLVEPTLLENVPNEAEITKTEVFGPVAYLKKYESLEEAVTKSNESQYGLHAAIFTKDLNQAFYAIHNLDSGSVIINDSTDYRVDLMPFGGRKRSGLGREGVKFALEEMTEPKVVCFNL